MENLIELTRSILVTTPARWVALAESLPEELLARPAASGEWSAVQCLQHLVDTERRVFPVRVKAFLAGRDFPAFDPDSQGTPPGVSTPSTLAQEFAGLRSASLELLAGLQEEDLQRKARHAELGPVTLNEMLHQWAAHDLNHTVQAERALMQPFIRGSGPWQSYFKDHLLPAGG